MSLGLAAIIISGLTFLWTVFWSVYAERPKLKVRGSWAAPVLGVQMGEPSIAINVTNTGRVPVTIVSVSLPIRGLEGASLVPLDWVVQTPTRLPVQLDPGSHWQGLVAIAGLKASLRERLPGRPEWQVRPAATDSAGRTHKAGWITLSA